MTLESIPFSRNLLEAIDQGVGKVLNQFGVEGPLKGTLDRQGHMGILPAGITQLKTEAIILESYSTDISIRSLVEHILSLKAPESWEKYRHMDDLGLFRRYVGHFRRNEWPTQILLVGTVKDQPSVPCANLYAIPGISPYTALNNLQEKAAMYPLPPDLSE